MERSSSDQADLTDPRGSRVYAHPRPRIFAGIAAAIVIVDQITKLIMVDYLGAAYIPHPVLGNWLRLTLVYNPGAAFGLHLGQYSRWIFMALTFGALWLLWRLYTETLETDRRRVVAIALVVGGAIGNLIDRIRSARGVVDFIDVGIGTSRWPTFNVADMAVSCGAILLAWILWREDASRAKAVAEAAAAEAAASSSTQGTAGAPANPPATDAPLHS
jgi:signal peptidase II